MSLHQPWLTLTFLMESQTRSPGGYLGVSVRCLSLLFYVTCSGCWCVVSYICSLRPEPLIHCWWVGGVSISWKQGRLMAEDALKGGKLGGWVSESVLCIFCPWEKVSPILLVVQANRPEESTNFLDGLLHLTVGLWVTARGEADGHSQFFHEALPDMRCEVSSLVTHDVFW